MRLSLNNVFNREYLSGVQTTAFNSVRYNGSGSSYAGAQTPYYTIGEEQTVALSVEANF